MTKRTLVYILLFLQFGSIENFEEPPRRLIDAPLNGHGINSRPSSHQSPSGRENARVDNSSEGSDSEEVYASGNGANVTDGIEVFQIVTPGLPVLPGNPGLPGLPGLPGMPGKPSYPELVTPAPEAVSKPTSQGPKGPPVPQASQKLWVVERCMSGIPGTPGQPGQPGTPGTPGIVIIGRDVDILGLESGNPHTNSRNGYTESRYNYNLKNSPSLNDQERKYLQLLAAKDLMNYEQIYNLESGEFYPNNEPMKPSQWAGVTWKSSWKSAAIMRRERRNALLRRSQFQGHTVTSGTFDFSESSQISDNNDQVVNRSPPNKPANNFPSTNIGQQSGNKGDSQWSSDSYGSQSGTNNRPSYEYYGQQTGQKGNDGLVGGQDSSSSQQTGPNQWQGTGSNYQQPDSYQTTESTWSDSQAGNYGQSSSLNGNFQPPSQSKWSNEQSSPSGGYQMSGPSQSGYSSNSGGPLDPGIGQQYGSTQMGSSSQWQLSNSPSDTYGGGQSVGNTPRVDYSPSQSSQQGYGVPLDSSQSSFPQLSGNQMSGQNQQSGYPSNSGSFPYPDYNQQFGNTQKSSFNSWPPGNGQSMDFDRNYPQQMGAFQRNDNSASLTNQQGYGTPSDNNQNSYQQGYGNQPGIYPPSGYNQRPGTYSQPDSGRNNEDNLQETLNQNVDLQAVPYRPGPPYNMQRPSSSVASSQSENGFSTASSQFQPGFGSGGWQPMYPGYPSYRPGYPYQPVYPPYQPGYPTYQPGYPTNQPGYPTYQPGYSTYQQGGQTGFPSPGLRPQVSSYPIG